MRLKSSSLRWSFSESETATYVKTALGQESQIDFVLVSRISDVNKFRVIDPVPDVNFSDHLHVPLEVIVAVSLLAVNIKPSSKGDRYTQKQLRWDKAVLVDY